MGLIILDVYDKPLFEDKNDNVKFVFISHKWIAEKTADLAVSSHNYAILLFGINYETKIFIKSCFIYKNSKGTFIISITSNFVNVEDMDKKVDYTKFKKNEFYDSKKYYSSIIKGEINLKNMFEDTKNINYMLLRRVGDKWLK